MNKYEIFLFDADGTLYDYDLAEANALRITFEYFGVDYSEAVRSKYREINLQLWKRYEKDEISKDDLQTLRFTRLFHNTDIQCEEKAFNKKYTAELGKGSFLINGALEICKTITSHNKRIYIITNGILATQEARIAHSPISEYISGYFVSEFVGFQKPHIKYFEYVLSHIPQVSKAQILIVGDSLSADIAGGNNVGIDTCWFNNEKNKNNSEIMPTYEISELAELISFI